MSSEVSCQTESTSSVSASRKFIFTPSGYGFHCDALFQHQSCAYQKQQIARYDVRLDALGYLASYRRLADRETAVGDALYD